MSATDVMRDYGTWIGDVKDFLLSSEEAGDPNATQLLNRLAEIEDDGAAAYRAAMGRGPE